MVAVPVELTAIPEPWKTSVSHLADSEDGVFQNQSNCHPSSNPELGGGVQTGYRSILCLGRCLQYGEGFPSLPGLMSFTEMRAVKQRVVSQLALSAK